MDQQGKILESSEQYVRQLFEQKVPAAYYFHDLLHTVAVAKAARLMADHYKLEGDDFLALMLAAWFHDTGYSRQYAEHELASVEIARDFLVPEKISAELFNSVEGCILATRMPQAPIKLIEQILCDADLFHLGTEHFEEQTRLLRKEINTVTDKEITKKDWRKINIRFLEQHNYFTEFARHHLDPGKKKNLEELQPPLPVVKRNIAPKKEGTKRRKEIHHTEPKPVSIEVIDPTPKPVADSSLSPGAPANPEKNKKSKLADPRPERGIATMFRIMSENHINLSQMADSKANIMISVNTIVLSILVSVLLGKLQYYPQFILPTFLLASSCLGAVVFAIFATRPNVTKGYFSEEDIRHKKVNLLFFGNFFKMELPDYEWAMKEMMKDSEYLYGSMIKDIYYLGKVLARKYHYLRISYNVFMFGLIIAVLAFGVAAFMGNK
ncbi:DUF5706 domain-containing protein [Flavihumibacter sediminis]|nr:DUF5706 domain-containing protein [Flavihumibacter sediminis]